MLILLCLIIIIGSVGAISFLKINNGIESESTLKASDFEIFELKD